MRVGMVLLSPGVLLVWTQHQLPFPLLLLLLLQTSPHLHPRQHAPLLWQGPLMLRTLWQAEGAVSHWAGAARPAIAQQQHLQLVAPGVAGA